MLPIVSIFNMRLDNARNLKGIEGGDLSLVARLTISKPIIVPSRLNRYFKEDETMTSELLQEKWLEFLRTNNIAITEATTNVLIWNILTSSYIQHTVYPIKRIGDVPNFIKDVCFELLQDESGDRFLKVSCKCFVSPNYLDEEGNVAPHVIMSREKRVSTSLGNESLWHNFKVVKVGTKNKIGKP